MHDTEMLRICLTAFGAVFIVLGFLAVAMRLLVVAFRERKAAVDAAVVAAISTAISTAIPGARVTRIEEK